MQQLPIVASLHDVTTHAAMLCSSDRHGNTLAQVPDGKPLEVQGAQNASGLRAPPPPASAWRDPSAARRAWLQGVVGRASGGGHLSALRTSCGGHVQYDGVGRATSGIGAWRWTALRARAPCRATGLVLPTGCMMLRTLVLRPRWSTSCDELTTCPCQGRTAHVARPSCVCSEILACPLTAVHLLESGMQVAHAERSGRAGPRVRCLYQVNVLDLVVRGRRPTNR